MKKLIITLLIGISAQQSKTQSPVFDIKDCIAIASDSSLQAFRAKNMYLASYWEHKAFRAARLPAMDFMMTPIQYNHNIIKRYDYNENVDVYRAQQSRYSSGTLSLAQNVDITGGTFFIDTELGYMKNYGDYNIEQFSSIPFRFGYSQSLFGYNRFKWERKIEPLKFEKAKNQFLYNIEEISEQTVQYYFSLLLAEEEYNMAQEYLLYADTLYMVGLERDKISTISQADISILELDLINAKSTLKVAAINVKMSKAKLATFLNLDQALSFSIILPERPQNIDIPFYDAIEYARINNPIYLSNRQDIIESERDVERAKKSAAFDASISANVGFNQVSNSFSGVYRSPLHQEIVAVGITIPIMDWGVKKGHVNMAKNNLHIIKISAQQKEQSLDQEVIITIDNFNLQQELLSSAERAIELANKAYKNIFDRYVIGKSDINSLTISQSRQKEARLNYLRVLNDYWISYYKIRKITLFDFEKNEHLSVSFDEKVGINK